MISYHAKARDRAAGKERPDAVPARDAVADELVLRPVVRRQLDGGAHGRPQGGGVHAAHEPAELLRVPDASQRVPRAFVVMLRTDGKYGRICLSYASDWVYNSRVVLRSSIPACGP